MSHPLGSFSIRVGKPLQAASATAADFDGSSALFSDGTHVSNSNFLAPQSEAPDSFLNLGEPSGAESLQNRNVNEVQTVALSSSSDVLESDVSAAPLLCLDPSTGLHVIVHDLETLHQPSVSQNPPDGEESPDQFVVVWALQSEDEPAVLVKSDHPGSKTANLSGPSCPDSILTSPVLSVENGAQDDTGVQQIFSPSIENTLDLGLAISSPQNFENNNICKDNTSSLTNTHETSGHKFQPKDASLMNCHDTPLLTLQVPEGRSGIGSEPELQEDILMEAVPHINLQEIIEKFTSESNHAFIETESNAHRSLQEKKEDHSVSVQEDVPTPQRTFTPLSVENTKVSGTSKVTVKVKTSASITEDSLDEENFYDVLMTYHCKLCSEVFIDKDQLLKHYREVHKSRKGVKVSVTSENNGSLATLRSDSSISSKKESVSPSKLDASTHKLKNLTLMSCRHCCRTFLGTKELEHHISQEHPEEVKKGARKRKHKVVLSLPTQPGLLFGHRKSRTSSQEDADDKKASKRPVRAPKDLDEQYWLQKQKPKPVVVNNKERTFKCSVEQCRLKFSSQENVEEHQQCHGQHGKEDVKSFFCRKCSDKFSKWGGCQLHLWKAHGIDIDLFTCGICLTYKTVAEQKLLVHQEIHSDTREYVCKYCGKAFHQHSQLLNHEVIHLSHTDKVPQWHQKSYCDKCDRWFGDKKALKKHINTVHLKLKRHSCPHCSYKCVRKYDLGIHIRKHTGEKPHKCEFCGLSYRNPTTVRRHRWSHFLIKPFKCSVTDCPFESAHITNFKKHISRCHPKEELLFQCETCSFKTTDLRKYNSHISVHENQLFQEALEKRGAYNKPLLTSSANSNTVSLGDDKKIQAPLPVSVTNKIGNSLNIRIEPINDFNKRRKVENESYQVEPSVSEKAEFVFEAGVLRKVSDTQNSNTNDNPCNDASLAGKVTSNLSMSVNITNLKSPNNNKLGLVKEEARNSFTQINPANFDFGSVSSVRDNQHGSKVFTINVGDLQTETNFLKDTGNLMKSEVSLKGVVHQNDEFGKVMETNILVPDSRETSIGNIGNEHIVPKMLVDKRPSGSILDVGNTERAPLISIEEEHQHLLSQVMADDSHQYIIGISPDEINASQTNIFALEQDGHL